MRTLEQLQRINEQVLDAILRGVMTPKQTDGSVTTLKAIKSLQVETPMRLMAMIAKYGKGGDGKIPYPRSSMVREYLNLSPMPPAHDAGKAFVVASELEAPSAPPTP